MLLLECCFSSSAISLCYDKFTTQYKGSRASSVSNPWFLRQHLYSSRRISNRERMLLVTTWFGTFLLDGKRVVEQRPAPRDPRELARRLRRIERGEILDEERELAALVTARAGGGEIPAAGGASRGESSAPAEGGGGVVSQAPEGPKVETHAARRARRGRLSAVSEEGEGKSLQGGPVPDVLEERLRSLGRLVPGAPPDLEPLGRKLGFGPELLHEATLWMGREKLGELGPDRLVTQAVAGLEELTRVSNLLTERLVEWYGLHLPELAESLGTKDFVEAVAEYGGREGVERAMGKKFDSPGALLSPADEAAIRSWASLVREVGRCRAGLEGYITKRMEELAPNLSAIVGPLLAARLLSLTGSLDRLARLPASTVQLLGAEKALFQFMKTGGRPPKHGVLFQHPLVHRAPPRLRGKVARALASSASLAARADAFGRRDITEAIKEGLQKKLSRIQKESTLDRERRGASGCGKRGRRGER